MIVAPVVFVLLSFLPVIQNVIYLYNTEDDLALDFYDCIAQKNLQYCRRPKEPIALHRNHPTWYCHNNGTRYAFADLKAMNVSVSTILHDWRSSLEKVEEYSRYLQDESNERNSSLCHCHIRHSFGKYCEYLLPSGYSLENTIAWKVTIEDQNPSLVQRHSHITCYITLQCNHSLLCLDWRDICDGIQQCMFGDDEENCKALQLNKCDKDEYRCTNGMCIPDEYFLDGEYDCMDWSDEKPMMDDAHCAEEPPSGACDDRMCPKHWWSCGDGQCIIDRLAFQYPGKETPTCRSRRDQFYLCESYNGARLWTMPNGKCALGRDMFDDPRFANGSKDCIYLMKCSLSGSAEKKCPCSNRACIELMKGACSSKLVQYPMSAIISPFVSHSYNIEFYQYVKTWAQVTFNGTIKCRNSFVHRTFTLSYSPNFRPLFLEAIFCNDTQLNRTNTNDDQSYKEYWKSFNNLSCTSIDFMTPRYRFRCAKNESTCLFVTALGDEENQCSNEYDEAWMGSSRMLAKMNCDGERKEHCSVLRRYVEQSWIIGTSNDISRLPTSGQISYSSYCDTFWNLKSHLDENALLCYRWWICRKDQWKCLTGQCIDLAWVLDGEWDCSDASDEQGILRSLFLNNQALINHQTIHQNFTNLYKNQAFSSICNYTTELPCFRSDSDDPLRNIFVNRPCIRLEQIGDGHVDCLGGIDERNRRELCDRTVMLGYHFKCVSRDSCISYAVSCDLRCANKVDDHTRCYGFRSSSSCQSTDAFTCLNGTCISKAHCNGALDCEYGEDEYMCDLRNLSRGAINRPYREVKELRVRNTKRIVQFEYFPLDTNRTQLNETKNDIINNLPSFSNATTIAYVCNRGIGVYLFNGSAVCLCPPQYFGDHCQFHNDRVTVFFHLNVSQSSYVEDNDQNIVVKLLVLFLCENQTLSTREFHVRPAVEIYTYKKKIGYFVDSRRTAFLRHSYPRLHDRYSVRIEAYETRTQNDTPSLIAVWQYPLLFNFLPNFRLAKALRLIRSKESDSCSDSPCNSHQQCHPLLNDPSKYICLCKGNYTGINCSELSVDCVKGYCSSHAICKPNYRDLAGGNRFPYCICPSNYHGRRCQLWYDRCTTNSCLNGGSCYPSSDLSRGVCLCTAQYRGARCEFSRPEIRLFINGSISHVGAVVQYFQIDFLSLGMTLVHQNAYRTLPKYIEHRYDANIVPEVVLVKLYANEKHEPDTYLISLHINVTTVHGITYVDETNRCAHVNRLLESMEDVPFSYHQLCRNDSASHCFRDDDYLCMCSNDSYRAECFSYDSTLEQCSHCLAGGRCLRTNFSQPDTFICLCPPCRLGSKCQFSSEFFSYSIDQLFTANLLSHNASVRRSTLSLLVIGPFLMLLFGSMNNLFCFVTFRRSMCLRNGVGQYLLCMSVINQINLGALFLRHIHIIVSHYSPTLTDILLCKLLSFLLTVSGRLVYWLVSLVAIERVYITLFLNGHWLKKPHIARALIALTLFVILATSVHELVFMHSYSKDNDSNSHLCVLDFHQHRSLWTLFHQSVTVLHWLVPLLINVSCTTTISYVVTKKKLNACAHNTDKSDSTNSASVSKKSKSRVALLLDVLKENKELILAPAITIVPQLFSLPLYIVAFLLICQNLETNTLRYMLIVCYFTAFLPQLVSFLLYVTPSSFFTHEWHATALAKWIFPLNRRHEQQPPTTTRSRSIAIIQTEITHK